MLSLDKALEKNEHERKIPTHCLHRNVHSFICSFCLLFTQFMKQDTQITLELVFLIIITFNRYVISISVNARRSCCNVKMDLNLLDLLLV